MLAFLGRGRTIRGFRIPRSLITVVFAAAGLALAEPACAQVLEIGADGGVTTYSGPSVYSSEGVRSLLPQPGAGAPARAAPEEVSRAIQDASIRHSVSTPLVAAVAWQESRYNQAAVSRKGALGVMQLMPDTARRLGVDAADLKGNIDGGTAYLSQMLHRFEGNLPNALAAYNAGPEAVQRYGGVPPYAETQAYVRAILGRLSAVTAVGTGAE
jgi:soluble lytic murein transglycosylase-like protein